ncbi:hypothetical protein PTTG_30389, partial [Puccinia triticina 1-1 BBBD Race 1]
TASRVLHGLSDEHMAPRFFSHCTVNGVPFAGIALTAAVGLLAFMFLDLTGVYEWFLNVASISILLTWWSILLTCIRFYQGLKHIGVDRNAFACRAPYQPWLSTFGFAMSTLIIIFNGFEVLIIGKWSPANFISAYISLPIFGMLFIGWKIFHRTAFIRVDKMDFATGRSDSDPVDVNFGNQKEVI